MPPVTESRRLAALKSAPLDRWILLSSDETTILATGSSFEEVSKEAEKFESPDELLVLKTPKSWAPLSV